MYKDVGKLIYVQRGQDEEGFNSDTQIPYDVFLNTKSVKRSEFYTAMQTGHKPTIVFNVRSEDYELTKHIVNGKAEYATKVIYDEATYDIIRSYQKNESEIELTCE